jgi:hypothetical protein
MWLTGTRHLVEGGESGFGDFHVVGPVAAGDADAADEVAVGGDGDAAAEGDESVDAPARPSV